MFSIKAIDQDDINFEISYVFATSEDCVHSYVSYFQRAVFVTLMLILLTCLKSTFRWTFNPFETQPYSASLILPLARSG